MVVVGVEVAAEIRNLKPRLSRRSGLRSLPVIVRLSAGSDAYGKYLVKFEFIVPCFGADRQKCQHISLIFSIDLSIN